MHDDSMMTVGNTMKERKELKHGRLIWRPFSIRCFTATPDARLIPWQCSETLSYYP